MNLLKPQAKQSQTSLYKSYKDEHSIELLEISVNSICNLKCIHCSHQYQPKGKPELSAKQWIQLLKPIAKAGVRRLHICGKEPLLYSDLHALIIGIDKLKNKYYFKYGMVTNGILLESFLPWLSKMNFDYLDISVDGLSSGHDYLRGSGSFITTQKAIAAAIESFGIKRICLATVVYPGNLKQVIKMVEVFSRMGIKYFFFQTIQPAGKARGLSSLQITEFQLIELLNSFTKFKTREKVSIEFFIDYRFKNFLLNHYSLFDLVCSERAKNKVLVFSVPMGCFQLTINYNCLAYDGSALITSTGELVGCSMQATSECTIGPSGGYITQANINKILTSYRIKMQSPFFHVTKNRFNIKTGITQCPVIGSYQ